MTYAYIASDVTIHQLHHHQQCPPPKTVIVIGATGSQDGSVVSSFLHNPSSYHLRVLIRSPTNPTSQNLSSRGVEVVSADVNHPSILGPAFAGAYVIFAATAYSGPPSPLSVDTGAGEEELAAVEEHSY
ncbi:hypothetical protein QBC32DRAFT_318930 [Pseudoneurospora amorphoporcata]|uniref:NmrA-like domain-containing protein n=1 Tax=Pseudoneurospora amorphoporcata TaxID=241081 RepID=A0AAN6SAS7_9PEZI|nr:hypothetical protein QBC32DRAFT_318930 [Pseudoneurospora amorphoporcata]